MQLQVETTIYKDGAIGGDIASTRALTQAKYAASPTGGSDPHKIAILNPPLTDWELFNGAEIFVHFTHLANPYIRTEDTVIDNNKTYYVFVTADDTYELVEEPVQADIATYYEVQALTLTLKSNSSAVAVAYPIKDAEGNDLAPEFYWRDDTTAHLMFDGANWRILDWTQKYNNLVINLETFKSEIGQKTNNLDNKITINSTKIQQTANNVLIQATTNTTTDPPTSQNAEEAGQTLIQSFINVAPEEIKIRANHLEITGTTIFDAINDDPNVRAAILNDSGRNLLLDTKSKTITLTNANTDYYIGYFEETDYGKTITNGNTSDYFVVSFDWETTSLTDTQAWIQVEGNIIANITEASGYDGTQKDRISLANGSGHYMAIFKLTSTQAEKTTQRLRLRIAGSQIAQTEGSTFTLSNLMFIHSNKPADWAPAPEESIIREQRIYYRSYVGTPLTGDGLPPANTWITNNVDIYNENNQTSTVQAGTKTGWTTKITPIAASEEATKKYLYLWTCIQREKVDGNIEYSDILLDDTTTIIDGGRIITGTVDVNQIAANAITTDKIDANAVTADKIAANSVTIGKIADNPENLLIDSDAPTLDKVNAAYPRYWSDTGNNKITCSNFTLSNAPEIGLKYGRRFTYDGSVATDNYQRAYAFYNNSATNNIPLIPNTTYTATWWARCTSGSGKTRLYYSKGNGGTASVGGTLYTLTSSWQKYTQTFTFGSTENTNYNRLWFQALFSANTAGEVEICGCKLIAEDNVNNYITYVNTTDGIQIHNTGDLTNYIKINSEDISMWRASKKKMSLDNSNLIFYDGNGTADTNKLAQYGSTIQIFKPGTGVAAVTIDSSGATFDGKIITNSGTIGGWNISTNALCSATTYSPASGRILLAPAGVTISNAVGNLPAATYAITASNNFGVTTGGKLYATGAVISGDLTATTLNIGGNNYASDIQTISNKASNSAEYEVIIKINSINYTTPSVTLVAVPTKLGNSTTGSFKWYKNTMNTEITTGLSNAGGNTNDTLTLSGTNVLDALYIAVLQ